MARLTVEDTKDSNGTPVVLCFSKKAIQTIKTLALSFTSDHGVMKDYLSDWQNNGTLFSKPEFKYGNASKPVSLTKAEKVKVKVDFEVWPKDADEVDVTIKGTAGWDASLTFEKTAKLKGGVITVPFTSNKELPDAVAKYTGDIKWSVTAGTKTWDADASWGHVLYVTMGIPDVSFVGPEAGITVKRMEKAVEIVGKTGTIEPHAIVRSIMSGFPGYRVPGSPLPRGAPPPSPDVNWPTYLPSATAPVLGGAWNIADDPKALGECQAISRYVRALLKQVGCPGFVATVLVFADPDTGEAKEAAWDPGRLDQGLASETRTEGATAAYVKLTTIMPARVGDIQPSLAMNNFEACVWFRYPDTTPPPADAVKYYPAGESDVTESGTRTQAVASSKEEVLGSFQALVWIAPAGPDKFRIVKIVKKYR
jgi:hypothetical protein